MYFQFYFSVITLTFKKLDENNEVLMELKATSLIGNIDLQQEDGKEVNVEPVFWEEKVKSYLSSDPRFIIWQIKHIIPWSAISENIKVTYRKRTIPK